MLKIELPIKDGKVLLHSCCAPCSAAIIECMLANDIRPTVFFYNPNIYPEEEYLIRKNEIVKFLKRQNIDLIDADYNHEQWLCNIQGMENEPERGLRCAKCFAVRLTATAKYASEHGFNIFTTTLASSRWKDLKQINASGKAAMLYYSDITFWDQNWRKGGLTEKRSQLLKFNGFYNQQYCGCEFSLRQMQKWRTKRDLILNNT
jgi:epoxyqueuosine reductase